MKGWRNALSLSKWDWMILLVASLPAFYLLGRPAIYIWDEAVYANASWDMAHGHSWLLPQQGHYNTKPPLVLWLQAICLKLFPSPEWAIRFPSAISVTGISLVLILALRRWGFDQWTRLCVVIALVAHEGFIRHHISRTGDLDAVMTFFVVIYAVIVLDAWYFKKWNLKYLICFFASVVLAFYAKSIAGWLMLGPILILWILSPMRSILWSKKFIAAGVLTVLLCGSYYIIREQLQPGFLPLVWHSEYLRIAKNIMTYHEHGFGYYFQNFHSLKFFTPWIFVVMVAMGYMLFVRKADDRKSQYVQWMVLALGYLLVISIPPVKLEWYDAPVYPFFALILGAACGEVIRLLPGRWKYLVLIPAFLLIWRKMHFIQTDSIAKHAFEYEGSMLRQLKDPRDVTVFMPVEYAEHRLQLDFYRKVFLDQKKIDVPVADQWDELKPGMQVLLRNSPWLDSLQYRFEVDTVGMWSGLGYELKLGAEKSEK